MRNATKIQQEKKLLHHQIQVIVLRHSIKHIARPINIKIIKIQRIQRQHRRLFRDLYLLIRQRKNLASNNPHIVVLSFARGPELTHHFQHAHIEADFVALEGELRLLEDVSACGEMRDGHVGDHADDEGGVCCEFCREGEEAVEFFDGEEDFGCVDVGVFFDCVVAFGWGWRRAFGDCFDGAVF
jgi:hypothetical protein